VYSEVGRGTSFKVYLPRVDGVPAAQGPGRGAGLRGGTETILLVEDEESVRRLGLRVLERAGYTVLAAAAGGEALAVAEAHPGAIHLLVTDVVMPGMSGREVAERMASLRPHAGVLFTSGYTDDAIVHHGVLDDGMAFLQKPFDPSTLLHAVRRVLDGTARSTEAQRVPQG
jgi:CheY-like chemotaxis protein